MKLRLLAVCLLLLLCCCRKNGGNTNNNNSTALTYATTYDSVLRVYANTTPVFAFSASVLTGDIAGKSITYTLTGMPAGVEVSPLSQAVSDKLSGIFTFSIGSIAAGDYTLDLASKQGTTATVHHKLILRVQANPDYAQKLAGSYGYCYDYCQPSNNFYYYASTVTAVSGTTGEITISNPRNLGSAYSITATVTNVVKIAPQTVNGYTIWGTGSFSHDNPPYDTSYMMVVYDTMAHAADTQACIMHIQRSH